MHIEILDVLGKVVFSEEIPSGETSITWTAEGLPEGVYFAKLKSHSSVIATRKLMLTR
jgi:hypothetical protein